jgi:hypothetical protein
LQQKIGLFFFLLVLLIVVLFLLGLQVTFAQRDMTRAGRGNLTAYTERDLLDLAAGSEEACSLLFNRKRGEICSRGNDWLAFLSFRSCHVVILKSLTDCKYDFYRY